LAGPSVSADRSADGRALVREAALDAVPAAHVVLGRDGTLISANRRARALFNLAAHDLGRPLKDLEISYRPVDLRTSLELVLSERRGETLDGVPLKVDGEDRTFDVQFFPLQRQDDVLGAMVVFEDVTAGRQLAEDFANSKHDLESAYEELQSTVEELETTNEELHSTNEELETTNEELQSTNQELETMNEQLHSTNEELQTINEELHQRTLEVNEGNAFLEAILTSIAVAVVVVDRDFTVQVWNGRSAELWGPSPEDVEGQDLLELDIGLPVASLRDGLRSVLAGTEDRVEVTLPATNRRGGRIRCRVASVPLTIAGEITGAVLLMADAATAEAAEPVGSRS
jgi:two-component system CheB/CheR fusion protein